MIYNLGGNGVGTGGYLSGVFVFTSGSLTSSPEEMCFIDVLLTDKYVNVLMSDRYVTVPMTDRFKDIVLC